MELFDVSKRFSFEASHSLPALPEGHKCRNKHGHSYQLEVVCRGKVDKNGFVIDYAEIAEEVMPIIEILDHHDLDDVLDFPSTAENLARWVYEGLKNSLPLYQVHIYETPTTRVSYPVR